MKTEYGQNTRSTFDRVYTVAEVAAILRMSKNKVYQLVKASEFSSRKIGTDIRISKASFDCWLDGHEPTTMQQ